jgi:hypothetical protein
MRKLLKRMVGERRVFRATFERYGCRFAKKGQRRQTVLLVNLADLDGNPITDHVWFNWNRRFRMLGQRQGCLQPGDVIEFEAVVTRYIRWTPDTLEAGFWWSEADYGLGHPAYLQKVERTIPVDWPVPEQVELYR